MTAVVISGVKFDGGKTHVVYASGKFATDAGTPAAYELTNVGRLTPSTSDPQGLGFRPRKVCVTQLFDTDGVTYNGNKWEWYEGMANDSALLTTAATGVVTLVTSAAVMVDGVYPNVWSYEDGDYDKDAEINPGNNFGNLNTPGEQPDHKLTLGTSIIFSSSVYVWECWA